MKNYKLYDVYDGFEDRFLIERSDDKEAIAMACIAYAEECEDDCIFALYQYNQTDAVYKLVPDWHYTKEGKLFIE